MVQRIQTIYLMLAVILMILCCCMPIAIFEPTGMGLSIRLYNLGLVANMGLERIFPVASLFILIVLSEIICIVALMGYRNRRRQMRECAWAMAFQLLWLINYAGYAIWLVKDTTFHPEFSATLPAIAFVFTFLAYQGVKKDEELVRSADRIR